MRRPYCFTPEAISEWGAFAEIDGKWYKARPLPMYLNTFATLGWRLKLAYGVFVGKYDALEWKE